MKKIFCILSILTIISPVWAEDTVGGIVSTGNTPVAQGSQAASAVTTTQAPRYGLSTLGQTDTTTAATPSYVKGAYNAAIKAVNTVADSIPVGAAPSDAVSGRAAIWIE